MPTQLVRVLPRTSHGSQAGTKFMAVGDLSYILFADKIVVGMLLQPSSHPFSTMCSSTRTQVHSRLVNPLVAIYVAQDTDKTYRWFRSVYVEISSSPGSDGAYVEIDSAGVATGKTASN
jgi:hypothetical protein